MNEVTAVENRDHAGTMCKRCEVFEEGGDHHCGMLKLFEVEEDGCVGHWVWAFNEAQAIKIVRDLDQTEDHAELTIKKDWIDPNEPFRFTLDGGKVIELTVGEWRDLRHVLNGKNEAFYFACSEW